MGCNCKKKFTPINNLKNKEVLLMAKDIYDTLIVDKDQNNISDLDWLEIYSIWNLLYPNSSGVPSKEKVVEDIKTSGQYLPKKKQ
jgi:hypothetical protein